MDFLQKMIPVTALILIVLFVLILIYRFNFIHCPLQ